MRFGLVSAMVTALVAIPGLLGVCTGEPAAYRFTPGDVIDVTVTPQHTFDRTVTIQPDGRISYPRVGQLQAAGLTVEELAEKLRDGLNRDLVDPRVTVSLKEASKQAVPRVSLLGAVRNPGVFEIKEGTTLAETLALAGGPTPTADLRRITITRADQSVLTVDLAQTEQTGRLERNAVLLAGDFIVVPQGAPPSVMVLGEVMKPGSVEIQGATRLLDAVSLAGGPTPKADLRRVTVARAARISDFGFRISDLREPDAASPLSGRGSVGPQSEIRNPKSEGAGAASVQTLDLQPLYAGGATADTNRNVLLQPGDTILIGETDERVYVLGRVGKPDIYPIKPNDRVLDVLVKAGGATSDADLSKAALVRQDEKGQPVAKSLDLKRIMATGNRAENEILRPGDVLFVPDKKSHRSAAESLGLIWPLTGLVSFFRR